MKRVVMMQVELTTEDVAQIIGVSVTTVRSWRRCGRYRKSGSSLVLPGHFLNSIDIVYYWSDLLEWAERNPKYQARVVMKYMASGARALIRPNETRVAA